ncbi:MAG: AarF/ABC1/UbiB kinase family protein [Bacillota bacterium]|nr:AarF/ABC1/UbiB kinase family protein [Bacillota bacterium]
MRYREIARVAAKYGFGFVADMLGQAGRRRAPGHRKGLAHPDVYRLSRWERVRRALEELGPTFIKIGQILSTRPDMVPPGLAAELEKLQDKAPPFGTAEAEAIIAAELGGRPSEVFERFEPEPVAAASLGQVHNAVLKTGEEVVVKVQRPGVEEAIRLDLEILKELAVLASRRLRLRLARVYNLVDIVDEIAGALTRELDYTVEAANADRFARNLRLDPRIVVPEVFWDYTTRRVLTMERLHGTKLTEVAQVDGEKAPYIDRAAVARTLVDTILRQILVHGFFHADLHPGNVIVTPAGNVGLMDFGMVGEVGDDLKAQFGAFFTAVAARSAPRLVAVLLNLGIAPRDIDVRSLTRDVDVLLRRYYGVPLSQISIRDLSKDVLDVALKHDIKVRADFSLVMKALATVEGTARHVYPPLNLVEVAQPFARRLVRERLKPASVMKGLRRSAAEYLDFAARLPGKLGTILDMATGGQLKVRWELEGGERFLRGLAVLVNRLAMSIVLASIIVGTSLVVRATPTVVFWRLPLAEVGFIIALVFGAWLLVSIVRTGRF